MASPLLQDPSNYANHRIAKACKKAKGTHIIPLQNMYGVIQKKKKKQSWASSDLPGRWLCNDKLTIVPVLGMIDTQVMYLAGHAVDAENLSDTERNRAPRGCTWVLGWCLSILYLQAVFCSLTSNRRYRWIFWIAVIYIQRNVLQEYSPRGIFTWKPIPGKNYRYR